jgi:hypothetical protein
MDTCFLKLPIILPFLPIEVSDSPLQNLVCEWQAIFMLNGLEIIAFPIQDNNHEPLQWGKINERLNRLKGVTR